MSQAELLTVYGADPGSLDSNGKTPIDYARLAVLVKLELKEQPASHRGSMCVSAGKLATTSWQRGWWKFSMN